MVSPEASVIIAAAGAGRRFADAAGRLRPDAGEPQGKAFALLAGRPILVHTLDRFAAVRAVTEIVVAVAPDKVDWAKQTFGDCLGGAKRLAFVAGGSDRTASVAEALAATDPGTELVAIHDAVRPLIRPAVIEEALRVAVEHGAAVVGQPVDHTVKAVAADWHVTGTVPRQALWLAQTPQVFRREVIMQAYQRREDLVGTVTDDAQLVEALGQAVVMVLGDAANIKITTPGDLRMCEALLAAGWPFDG
jgi:2-C-methyl-D-erythritol 4-phosphate cytidylyltransferase